MGGIVVHYREPVYRAFAAVRTLRQDALTITGTTVTGNKGTLFVTAAGFDFEGCAEDAVTIDRIRKGRCINAEAGTRKKGTFGI